MARSVSAATRWPAITFSDTVNIATGKTAGIMCGSTGGTFQCVDEAGNVAATVMAAGEIKPMQVMRINSTSSTAVTVYALYNE